MKGADSRPVAMAANQPPLDLHEQMRAALREVLQERDLARWMETHRKQMAEMLASGTMDWEQAAQHFARAGLRDVNGEPPTAISAEAGGGGGRRAQAEHHEAACVGGIGPSTHA